MSPLRATNPRFSSARQSHVRPSRRMSAAAVVSDRRRCGTAGHIVAIWTRYSNEAVTPLPKKPPSTGMVSAWSAAAHLSRVRGCGRRQHWRNTSSGTLRCKNLTGRSASYSFREPRIDDTLYRIVLSRTIAPNGVQAASYVVRLRNLGFNAATLTTHRKRKQCHSHADDKTSRASASDRGGGAL